MAPLKGNHGTPFLHDTEKPFLVALADVAMQDEFPSEGSNDVTTLKPQEVLEVLEGPRKESTGVTIRCRGKAVSDGKLGWFTVMSRQGQKCATLGEASYVCKAAIALTSDLDINKCDVVRKLDRGEVLNGIGEPTEDGETGVFRVHCRAVKDGAEGWVTLKGNYGTVYVQETGRQYTVVRKIPLQSGFQASSDEVRMIAEGEVFDVKDAAKEEQAEPVVRAQVRAVSSGAVGWVSVRPKTLRLWAPRYKCVQKAELKEKLEASSQVVRAVEIGETFELLDGPKEETTGGGLRFKVKASKDGVVGWIAAVDKGGKPLVESNR